MRESKSGVAERRLTLLAAVLFLLVFPTVPVPSSAAERLKTPETCTYTVQIWNSKAGKVTRTERVRKKYADVTEKERDRGMPGCTACVEDQVRIRIPGLEPFLVCHRIADKVETALRELVEQGEPVLTVSGYRPVRSRGGLNADNERTELSNHTFGTAVDINRMQNGLYNSCRKWGTGCTLALGGPWRPGETKGSLSPDGEIVRKLKAIGLKWGGEIQASQKDFMHFSLTGF